MVSQRREKIEPNCNFENTNKYGRYTLDHTMFISIFRAGKLRRSSGYAMNTHDNCENTCEIYEELKKCRHGS